MKIEQWLIRVSESVSHYVEYITISLTVNKLGAHIPDVDPEIKSENTCYVQIESTVYSTMRKFPISLLIIYSTALLTRQLTTSIGHSTLDKPINLRAHIFYP